MSAAEGEGLLEQGDENLVPRRCFQVCSVSDSSGSLHGAITEAWPAASAGRVHVCRTFTASPVLSAMQLWLRTVPYQSPWCKDAGSAQPWDPMGRARLQCHARRFAAACFAMGCARAPANSSFSFLKQAQQFNIHHCVLNTMLRLQVKSGSPTDRCAGGSGAVKGACAWQSWWQPLCQCRLLL